MALRQQIRFCTAADGARIAYATTGQGPPLVKVANWLTHLEFDLRARCGATCWTRCRAATRCSATTSAAAACRTGTSTLSFDAGCATSRPSSTRVGLERFPLLGISQGASIAIAYAVRHPERVSAPDPARRLRARAPALSDGAAAAREGPRSMIKLAEIGWGQRRPGVPPVLHEPVHSRRHARAAPLVQRARARLDVAAQRGAHHARVPRDRRQSTCCRSVACPTLVLHAADDARVPFDEGRLIASAHPGRALRAARERATTCCSTASRRGRAGSRRCAQFLGRAHRAATDRRFADADAARARPGRADRAGPRQRADRRRTSA